MIRSLRKHVVWSVLFAVTLLAQDSGPDADALQQRIAGLQLVNQTIVDGLAKLSEVTGVSYSVEYELTNTISDSAPPLKRVTTSIPPETISMTLDQLCAADRSYTWTHTRTAVNVFPKKLEQDQHYLLNQRIPLLAFVDITDAKAAVFSVVSQVGGRKQQIAVLQSGTSLSFPKPWTATFSNVTVRQAFDYIAQHLGPTFGWQFGGADDFRVLTFHDRLTENPASGNATK